LPADRPTENAVIVSGCKLARDIIDYTAST
jgi:hypothetical protein